MRNYINFFGYYIYSKILRKETPEGVSKFKGTMCGKPMMPDGTMRTHNDHTVDKSCQDRPPAKVGKEKNKEKWNKASYFQPAKKGEPVALVLKNIQSFEKFAEYLFWARFNKVSIVVFPSVAGGLEYMI